MSGGTAKYPITIPTRVRKELGIIPGTDVGIAKEGDKYVLVVDPITVVKRKWGGRFKGRPTTAEYMDDVRGKLENFE